MPARSAGLCSARRAWPRPSSSPASGRSLARACPASDSRASLRAPRRPSSAASSSLLPSSSSLPLPSSFFSSSFFFFSSSFFFSSFFFFSAEDRGSLRRPPPPVPAAVAVQQAAGGVGGGGGVSFFGSSFFTSGWGSGCLLGLPSFCDLGRGGDVGELRQLDADGARQRLRLPEDRQAEDDEADQNGVQPDAQQSAGAERAAAAAVLERRLVLLRADMLRKGGHALSARALSSLLFRRSSSQRLRCRAGRIRRRRRVRDQRQVPEAGRDQLAQHLRRSRRSSPPGRRG